MNEVHINKDILKRNDLPFPHWSTLKTTKQDYCVATCQIGMIIVLSGVHFSGVKK